MHDIQKFVTVYTQMISNHNNQDSCGRTAQSNKYGKIPGNPHGSNSKTQNTRTKVTSISK